MSQFTQALIVMVLIFGTGLYLLIELFRVLNVG